jgi:hypothetical protein
VRYLVTIKNNRIVDVKSLDDDEEEYLGLEWALSEVKDSYRHSHSADGSYTLAGKEELAEFLDKLGALLGADALGTFMQSHGGA